MRIAHVNVYEIDDAGVVRIEAHVLDAGGNAFVRMPIAERSGCA